jgi:SAM-dependent methyltransferase
MLTESLNAACPTSLRDPLTRYLAGEISGEITLMHFILRLGAIGALTSTLKGLASAAPELGKLADLVGLATTNSDKLARVTALVEGGLAYIPSAGNAGVDAIRDQFDRAVAIAPEAAVALYSLGSSEILGRANEEILARLTDWSLLSSDLMVLDIGCGIGRIERILATRVRTITAIDVSSHMLDEARRRCRDLANASFQQCNGRDLTAFEDRSFDLIIAVDSFPCMFAADPEIAARHIRDCSRLLRSGGSLVIFNFSYRGDDEADRRDVKELAEANGFTVQRLGTRDFSLWDGVTFLLRLPSPRIKASVLARAS